jgi:hypothetical protein
MTSKLTERAAALFVVALLALVTGCATSPARISPTVAAQFKTVAVVSTVAQQFNRHYTGATAFGNETEKINIADWKVDDEFEQQIVEAMNGVGPIKAVRLPDVRQQLLGINDPNGPWNAPAFAYPKWSAVEGKLRELAVQHKVDGFVLVTPRMSPDFLAGTNQFFSGSGFYARGFGGSTSVSMMHVIAWVSIADANGKPVGMVTLAGKHEGWGSHMSVPLTSVAADLSRAPLTSYDEGRNKSVRALLVDVPGKSWAATINALLYSKP